MPPRRQQPSRKPISLGAALWGGHPAHGHWVPSQLAPDAWLRQLATQHRGVLYGLLTSCRRGRDVALQIAGRLGLTLDCCEASKEPTDVWLRRAASVQQALTTRGAQPTSLSVLCSPRRGPFTSELKLPYDDSLSRLNAVPEYLKGAAGQTVTDLRLTICQSIAGALWMKELLGYCPNLVSLHLNTYPYPLPAPKHLPQLRQISMQHGEDEPYERLRSCRSISKYLPQLTSLTLDTCDDWTVVFKPTSTTQTLVSFSTEQPLTDELLTALLDHAPALTQLSVSEISDDLNSYEDREWALEQLAVGYLPEVLFTEDVGILDRLAALPRRKDGATVTVKGHKASDYVWLSVYGDEGIMTIDPSAIERLSEWRFDVRNIDIKCECVLDPADNVDQLPMLTAVLNQLASLRTAPGVPVRLRQLKWTAPMAQAVAQAMPTLGHLELGVATDINDDSLGTILQMGPLMRHLWESLWDYPAAASALQSDQHANVPWPWLELHCGHCIGTQDVLRLPDPGVCDRTVRCRKISCFVSKELSQADTDRLMARLQYLVFTHQLVNDECGDKTPLIKIHTRWNDTADVRRQLSVLHAIRIQTPHPVHLRLWELKLNAEALAILQGLPAWSCCLIFDSCEWPNDPTLMRKLGAALPPTYTYIEIDERRDAPKSQLLASFCRGLADRRAQTRDAREVMVYCPGSSAGEDVRVGKHVLWTGKGWRTMQLLYGEDNLSLPYKESLRALL